MEFWFMEMNTSFLWNNYETTRGYQQRANNEYLNGEWGKRVEEDWREPSYSDLVTKDPKSNLKQLCFDP